MPFRHFPKHQFTTMAWKNGGGITHEIIRQPETASDWQWRISIAEIHQDGLFSVFPGCDRALTILSGAGMQLHFADRVEVMKTVYDTLRFSGEETVEAVLTDGPTTDFNAIWRRDSVTISLERRAMIGSLWCIAEPGVTWFVYFLSGQGRIKSDPGSPLLESGDGLWLQPMSNQPRLILEAHGEALWLKITAL